MTDLVYNAFLEEDEGEIWYTAIAKPSCKTGNACLSAQGDTYAELKEDILQSVQDCLQLPHHEEAGIPKNPSITLHFTEELYPGKSGEASVLAEKNCKLYFTKPNEVLKQAYEHETFEGLRALVKKAIRKAKPNGKKIVLVLEEILQ